MSPIRQHLRTLTGPLHAQVDAAFGRFDLATRPGYTRFLRAHARALLALEQALEHGGMAGRLPDWPQRKRSDALAADLAALGEPLPPSLPAPRLTSDARGWCWGAAYVLEGSRLGGRVLTRQVQTSGQPNAPLAYLSHGSDQPLWPRFIETLETAVTLADDADALRAGAEAAFGLFLLGARCELDAVLA